MSNTAVTETELCELTSRGNYGMYFSRIIEQIDCIITKPQCIYYSGTIKYQHWIEKELRFKRLDLYWALCSKFRACYQILILICKEQMQISIYLYVYIYIYAYIYMNTWKGWFICSGPIIIWLPLYHSTNLKEYAYIWVDDTILTKLSISQPYQKSIHFLYWYQSLHSVHLKGQKWTAFLPGN